MSGRLAGKNIIVAGGASGIWAAQVLRFAAEGARAIVTDCDERRGSCLMSDESAYTTGAEHVVDGGYTAYWE